jgi:hypothetical protein
VFALYQLIGTIVVDLVLLPQWIGITVVNYRARVSSISPELLEEQGFN